MSPASMVNTNLGSSSDKKSGRCRGCKKIPMAWTSLTLVLIIAFVRRRTTVTAFASIYQNSREKTCVSMSTASEPPKPALPIPKPICSDVPGTWAYDTMKRRVNEEILQRTYEDNEEVWETPEFSEVLDRFLALRKDLESSSKLTMLDDLNTGATPDQIREWNEWKLLLQPFLEAGDTWLTAPWLVTEFFVYRRLMESIGYWNIDSIGYKYDPFAKQKRAGLESSVGSAGECACFCPLFIQRSAVATHFILSRQN